MADVFAGWNSPAGLRVRLVVLMADVVIALAPLLDARLVAGSLLVTDAMVLPDALDQLRQSLISIG